MEKISKKDLEDLILHGLAVDIFKAERSYSLFKTIGNNGEVINESKGFKELFRELQDSLKDQFLLAIARLFDTPSKKYPTRCVDGFLQFLSLNSSRLPEIVEHPNFYQTMSDIGVSKDLLDSIKLGKADASIAIVTHFRTVVTSPETKRLLNRLKDIRDKRLAHNELIPEASDKSVESDIVTFKELFGLVSIAKNLVGVVGWAYMSTVFMHKGSYHLTSHAERPQLALIRLLNGLKEIKPSH